MKSRPDSTGPSNGRGLRRWGRQIALAGSVAVMAAFLPAVEGLMSAQAAPHPPCPVNGCQVTIDAQDFHTGNSLANFNFIINLDNTKLPSDPLALSTESNSPIMAEGGCSTLACNGPQDRKTVPLPAGRYLVSVRSLDHKMWGAYFTLPDDADNSGNLTEHIQLTTDTDNDPLPLAKLRVFVFDDNAWTNGAPDTEEGGLGGFQVGLEEQTGGAVTVDYNNNPLCGGVCRTSSNPASQGFVEIPNLGPATYFIDVHPPKGPCNGDPNSYWTQTTTIDGGLTLWAPTEEGADGTGAPGEQLWEPPDIRTAYWFGFVCVPQTLSGNGSEITGQARNWVEWAPYTVGTYNDPVENPYVALSDATSDTTVYVGRGDANGNFDIEHVPPGDYNLAIWDEQLSYIMRFKPVHVASNGQVIDVNDTGDDGVRGVGVSRWFGWLDGTVYKDVNGNGKYDQGVDAPLANTDVDQRWRDGSIKEGTMTDPNGYYSYPTAEGGALGRWIIGEQGFGRFSADPGASVYDEHTGVVTPSCLVDGVPAQNPCIPNALGGGLLVNTLILEGHRMTVDWGKRDYAPGTPGQIVGITYFATTRNEFFADKQAHEPYEPAIPDATVLLETPGPDGIPNTNDDVVVNSYVTDHWSQPSCHQDPDPTPNIPATDACDFPAPTSSFHQDCRPIKDFNGNPINPDPFNPIISRNCLEVPLTGEQTKEGAFDGGYAFADYCPNGYNMALDNGTCTGGGEPVPLVAGNYIVHAIMPKDTTDSRPCNPTNESQRVTVPHGNVPGGGNGCLYRIVREEDVNVDLGNKYAPAIPPPPCNGDVHVIDQGTVVDRSPYFGTANASAPLCDKHLVELKNGQNANADFFMMTNFPTDPNGSDSSDTQTGDVAEPGRVVGQVFNDIYFERDINSPWYGEPRPIANIPVGIYARVDTTTAGAGSTANDVNCPPVVTSRLDDCWSSDNWRLIKTVNTTADGAYEALLPSTETWNCPIPQGPCPGMYLLKVNDPGSKAHPNPNYNPNILEATSTADVWPGQTTQMDTPLDPISGTACEDPAGGTNPDPSDPAVPELLQVSRAAVLASDSGTARRVTIQGDFISSPNNAAGTVRLTDLRSGIVTDLTTGNGGVVSWTPQSGSTPDTIVIQVPAVGSGFTPGPKQMSLISAASNGAVSSVNGLTLHVLGAAGGTSRTDSATTSDPRRVADTAAAAADVGRTVTGTGIPANSTITAVTPGVGFLMDNPSTTNGTSNVTITKVDTGVSITRTGGQNVATDPSVVAGDVGRTVAFTGPGQDYSGRTILSVNTVNHTFVFSGNAVATLSGKTATITRTDAGATRNDGRFVADAAVVAGDVGQAVTGPGIPAGATVSSLTAGGFVLSVPVLLSPAPGAVSIVIGSAYAGYTPTIVNVGAPTLNGHQLQNAIDAAAPGSLLLLSAGTYNENVLMDKPLKIQGLGPGGIIGAHELQARDPEDPRFNIMGSVVDGRYFTQNAAAFDARVTAGGSYVLPPFANNSPSTVLRGADITVVAKTTTAYGPIAEGTVDQMAASTARIDGLGLMTGSGEGAGGVQLQASINNMQITNNVLENNSGVVVGGIGIGQPYVHGSHNYNARMNRNRVVGNGGLTEGGGIGIFYGSNNYEVANSVVCSNFSVNYGAGVSHIGLSPNGDIHDNRIYYNEAADSGGGIAIESEIPITNPPAPPSSVLGDGTGAVNVDRNLIQSNTSIMDDGGGMFVLDALDQPINIRNNMIVNNLAADMGGAITLDDSSRVAIINNTIANNNSTASTENSALNQPHSAGLASEGNESIWQTDSRYTTQYPNAGSRPGFSNPVALFNNIFWNNNAFTLDQFGPGATLVPQGVIDFEIRGGAATGRFTPRFSDLTTNLMLNSAGNMVTIPSATGGGNQGNLIGTDPLFVTQFINELTVAGARLDPQAAAVTITGQDPPVGLTGDYHLTAGSPVIDRGVGFSNIATAVPANQTPTMTPVLSILAPCSGMISGAGVFLPGDFDRQFRPQMLVNSRARRPWDLGADEVPATGTGTVRIFEIPGPAAGYDPPTNGAAIHFNWNFSNTTNFQCSSSTVLPLP